MGHVKSWLGPLLEIGGALTGNPELAFLGGAGGGALTGGLKGALIGGAEGLLPGLVGPGPALGLDLGINALTANHPGSSTKPATSISTGKPATTVAPSSGAVAPASLQGSNPAGVWPWTSGGKGSNPYQQTNELST